MVDKAALIRVSSVIALVFLSWGTLKSTRIMTFLPATLISLIVFLFTFPPKFYKVDFCIVPKFALL